MTQTTEHRAPTLLNIPILVALTGGIGSGKSYIAAALRAKGYPVYDCDQAAKRIIETDQAVRSQMESLFGTEVYTADVQTAEGRKHYNSKIVAAQVFHNPDLLQRLNQIVHPAVRQDIQHWANKQTSTIAFVESAILFESGLDALCKAIICVTAPEDVRMERAMNRDKATAEQIKQRISNQMPETERQQRSSLIVENGKNSTITDIIYRIETFVLSLS